MVMVNGDYREKWTDVRGLVGVDTKRKEIFVAFKGTSSGTGWKQK
jgi:hypothetical protein